MPSSSIESHCTFTLASDVTAGGLPSEEEIAKDLESSDASVKRHALKAAIMAMLGGETMPRILMQVIRFCINSDDKPLKKLTMLYWEVVPKYQDLTSDELLQQAAGNTVPRKLLPEMILVCNALMNDLNHANEYVRGSMLRFLCKIKDEEILGPLIPSIKSCLTHRHSYVRKSAALCIFHISKLHAADHLLPDGSELIAQFLSAETDMAARRNAFLMLINENEEFAFEFLGQHIQEGITQFGDGFCLLVLELTRRVCRRDPNQKSRFVRVLFQMLSSNSAAVSYEAAWTLVSLSSSPTAVRAAAVTYANLLNGQNDNNIQLIVLDRLEGLQKKHGKIVQELLMDILRALSSPNPDICEKVLEIAMDSINARNVGSVVTTLKRELQKSLEDDSEKSTAVRHLLVAAIHDCAKKFPEVAESVVGILMELLSSSDRTSLQVATFVRAIIQEHPPLRQTLLPKLLDSLEDISSPPVMCVALWILGEFTAPEDAQDTFDEIVKEVGSTPFVIEELNEEKTDEGDTPKLVTKNVVLADGTYATQTSYASTKTVEDTDKTPKLRKMIVVHGDVFVAETLASSLTKLVLQFPTVDKPRTAKTVLILCAICKLAESGATVSMAQRSSASDCQDRCSMCCRVLLDAKTRDLLKPILMEDGKKQLAYYLEKISEDQPQKKKDSEPPLTQADDLIHFRQLKSLAVNAGDVDLDDGGDLERATGLEKTSTLAEELSHCFPLSGFADPVYAEANVTVHDYDIVLKILIINRTPNTLADLSVELSTMGDMKIVERPQAQTLGPMDQTTIRASIKVSSTETGHIFGTIVYTDMATQQQKLINLNDIHMDIMDYIRPATCSDEMFRSMWAEFEWENKVAIATSITCLSGFLDHIVESTKMKCLTDRPSEENMSSFLAANLYARSVFGEDALVNVSVEKKEDNNGKLAGYIRIRSKTQGIALSLGDRITSVQRSTADK